MAVVSFEDRVKLIQLHSIPGFGERSLFKAFQETTDLDRILFQINKESHLAPRLNAGQATEMAKKSQDLGVEVLPIYHERYPSNLKMIYDPPPIIYIEGTYQPSDKIAIGVVGTRRYTEYGYRVISALIPALVSRGITVISGLALGIDSFAHNICLKSKGRTGAVLGSGIDIIVPAQNSQLAKGIIESGFIISEFPLGTEANKFNFPLRNRIIAGLSLGILVIEAGERSGALITANSALEQGKDVFAVPGDIFSHASVGTNQLIKMGAKLVAKIDDILEEIPRDLLINHSSVQRKIELHDRYQQQVYSLLKDENLNVDEIISKIDEEPKEILSAISRLELNGIIKRLGGDYFCLN